MLDRRTGELPVDGLGEILSAQIRGEAKSKGSLKNVARKGRTAHLVEQVDGSEAWKNTMIKHFHRLVRLGDGTNPVLTLPGFPYDDAVIVSALFTFQKPLASVLDFPSTQTFYDLDKLQRNLGDALEQSGVLKNDARIIEWRSRKRFVGSPDAVGVFVSIFDARTVLA